MRIYLNTPLTINETIPLSDEAFNHVIRVMRKQEGDEITVFNGQGGEYLGTLTNIAKKSADIKIKNFIDRNNDASIKIHLIQSFSKGDKMDFTIQKATELGVSRITPFLSEHSSFKLDKEKQDKRLQHWQSIIESACEQCGLNRLPTLTQFTDIKTIFDQLLPIPYLVFSPTAPHSLGSLIREIAPNTQEIGVMIGPEGGLSDVELSRLSEEKNVHFVKVGPRILRTETAGLVAMSSLHGLIGDWQ